MNQFTDRVERNLASKVVTFSKGDGLCIIGCSDAFEDPSWQFSVAESCDGRRTVRPISKSNQYQAH